MRTGSWLGHMGPWLQPSRASVSSSENKQGGLGDLSAFLLLQDCDRLWRGTSSGPGHRWLVSPPAPFRVPAKRDPSHGTCPDRPRSVLGCLMTPLLTYGLAAAHTPDNSFMGFVSEELNETEKQLIKDGKASNMAVVYGKEASIWKVSLAAASRAPGTSQPLPGPQALPPPGLSFHPSPPAQGTLKTSPTPGSEKRSLTAVGNTGLEARNLELPHHLHSLPQTQMSSVEECDLTLPAP